jgi:hypothetical protein
MRDNSKPSPVLAVLPFALAIGLFTADRWYSEKYGRLPGQINTWDPTGPATPPSYPNRTGFAILRTRYGEPRVVDTIIVLPDGRVIEGEPDADNSIRWRYRRQP